MAGVTQDDSGTPIKYQSVPSIGGNAKIVDGGHVDDAKQAVSSYPETYGAGPMGDGVDFHTKVKDTTPNDPVN